MTDNNQLSRNLAPTPPRSTARRHKTRGSIDDVAKAVAASMSFLLGIVVYAQTHPRPGILATPQAAAIGSSVILMLALVIAGALAVSISEKDRASDNSFNPSRLFLRLMDLGGCMLIGVIFASITGRFS